MELNRSLLLVFILSSLLYVELSIGRLFGESQFYSLVEHLVFILYGLSSFFCCLWSANRLFKASQNFSWLLALKYMLISGLLNAVITSVIFVLVRFAVASYHNFDSWLPPVTGLLVNVFYTFLTIHLIIAALYLSYFVIRLSHQMELRQKEAEKQSAEAKFQLLQQQLTPHFLFNSLSVLASLIPIDAKLAEQYVTKFAHLYRFVLKNKDEELILLQQEINFIKEYLQLMNIRFANAYQLQMSISDEQQKANWIVPGGLQLCVENAIKHNVATSDSPLLIRIEVNDGRLFIANKIIKKQQQVPSTNTGLANLKARYQVLSKEPILVTELDSTFSVSIPLIKLNN